MTEYAIPIGEFKEVKREDLDELGQAMFDEITLGRGCPIKCDGANLQYERYKSKKEAWMDVMYALGMAFPGDTETLIRILVQVKNKKKLATQESFAGEST